MECKAIVLAASPACTRGLSMGLACWLLRLARRADILPEHAQWDSRRDAHAHAAVTLTSCGPHERRPDRQRAYNAVADEVAHQRSNDNRADAVPENAHRLKERTAAAVQVKGVGEHASSMSCSCERGRSCDTVCTEQASHIFPPRSFALTVTIAAPAQMVTNTDANTSDVCPVGAFRLKMIDSARHSSKGPHKSHSRNTLSVACDPDVAAGPPPPGNGDASSPAAAVVGKSTTLSLRATIFKSRAIVVTTGSSSVCSCGADDTASVAAEGRGAAAMLPSTIGGAGTAAAIVAKRRARGRKIV